MLGLENVAAQTNVLNVSITNVIRILIVAVDSFVVEIETNTHKEHVSQVVLERLAVVVRTAVLLRNAAVQTNVPIALILGASIILNVDSSNIVARGGIMKEFVGLKVVQMRLVLMTRIVVDQKNVVFPGDVLLAVPVDIILTASQGYIVVQKGVGKAIVDQVVLDICVTMMMIVVDQEKPNGVL